MTISITMKTDGAASPVASHRIINDFPEGVYQQDHFPHDRIVVYADLSGARCVLSVTQERDAQGNYQFVAQPVDPSRVGGRYYPRLYDTATIVSEGWSKAVGLMLR